MNSDESVRRLKPGRPINTEDDRAAVLRALRSVDNVILFDEDTATELILVLRPDIYVKGGDYGMNTPEAKAVRSYGGSVVSAPFLGGYSTTNLIQRLR
jgi:rfaE bifunctional protein nucleotidyltransferase chain/domain